MLSARFGRTVPKKATSRGIKVNTTANWALGLVTEVSNTVYFTASRNLCVSTYSRTRRIFPASISKMKQYSFS